MANNKVTQKTEPDSRIVIGPDGTVLAATGQLPPGIVDARLEDCEDLSREIREAGRDLLHELHRSGNRVISLILPVDGGDRTVELVALEALAIRRRATDVSALLTSKLAVISFQAAAHDVTLHVVVADTVPAVVYLDSEKIAWAVTTLVGNSLRYMRSGSRRLGGGSINVRADFDQPRSEVTIEVQDDGPGIPADTVTRLFKRDGLNVQGAGLALLLISDICVAHSGRVDVHSSTDVSAHGTTVRLTLPTH